MQLISSAVAPPEARRDAPLLHSKFAVPSPAPGMLEFARLQACFDAALAGRLTVLNAPPGFGKTTTMVQLHAAAQARGVATAWLTLDGGDNDPLHFLRYVEAALAQAIVHGKEAGARCAATGAALPLDSALHRLSLELALADTPLLLFIDDYHQVDNPVVHRVLEWLLERMPARLGFVVASRLPLPLALGKLRLAGAVADIGVAALALTAPESAAFVRAALMRSALMPGDRRPVPNDQQLQLLHQRTEGWPAGLQLAASALASVVDVDQFVQQFSGSDRDITDYLGELVMHQLPGPLLHFLMRTALFERFSVRFCQQVLGEADAAGLIEAVQRRNLFVVPLDRNGEWFRYHQLFAQLLRQRFRLAHADEATALYHSASRWFVGEGCAREAIACALAAGDVVSAASLIDAHVADAIGVRGEHTTLLNWVAALPPSCVDRHPRLRLAAIWALIMSNRYREAEKAFARIEADGVGQGGLSDADNGDGWRRKLQMMHCTFLGLTGRPSQADRVAASWLDTWGRSGSSVELATVLTTAAYCALRAQEFDRASRSLATARAMFERHDSLTGLAFAATVQALVLFEQGCFVQAEASVTAAWARITGTLGVQASGATSLAMIRAYLCYEQNKTAEAERLLEAVFSQVDQHTFAESAVAAYLTRARILFLNNHHDAADDCLATGMAVAERLGLARMHIALHAGRVQLFLQAGRVDDAQRIAAADSAMAVPMFGSDSRAPHQGAPHELGDRLMRIRLGLAVAAAEANWSAALAQLNDLVAEARREGRRAWLVKLLCVKAGACAGHGQQREALRVLDEALGLGGDGMCRTFLDEGPLVLDLLQQIGAQRGLTHPALLAAAVAVKAGCAAAPALQPALDKADTLTERELQMLRLAGTGLRNKAMAAQLFVSEETVKWHLRNIYAKLQVGGRTAALARARALGLLD